MFKFKNNAAALDAAAQAATISKSLKPAFAPAMAGEWLRRKLMKSLIC